MIHKISKFKHHLFKIPKCTFSKINYSFDSNNFLNKTEEYEKSIKDRENNYNFLEEKIKGFATSNGTLSYSESNKNAGKVKLKDSSSKSFQKNIS